MSLTRVSCSPAMPNRWIAGTDGGASCRPINGASSGSARILGMLLPALLYVTFLPRGTNIQGLGISAALASAIGSRTGAGVGAIIAFLGAWLLFKTQLDNLEGMVRAIADILWTGSRRVRAWRGGDVRAVYYTVLAILVVWGLIAMRHRPADRASAARRQCGRRDLRHRRSAPALHQYAAAAAARAAADVAPGRARRDDALLRILRRALVRELVRVVYYGVSEPLNRRSAQSLPRRRPPSRRPGPDRAERSKPESIGDDAAASGGAPAVS